jgi:hypothetical protein
MFSISVAHAHETDRESKLKITNDELTIRVAELLKEKKKLEAALRETLIAKFKNQRVVEGCDTQDLRKKLVSGDGFSSQAKSWLDTYGEKCNREQLQYLIKNLDSWSSFSMKDPIRYVRFLMDN